MINRRKFLKLTAAVGAALMGLKPKAKPRRIVGRDCKIEVEYNAGEWVGIGNCQRVLLTEKTQEILPFSFGHSPLFNGFYIAVSEKWPAFKQGKSREIWTRLHRRFYDVPWCRNDGIGLIRFEPQPLAGLHSGLEADYSQEADLLLVAIRGSQSG